MIASIKDINTATKQKAEEIVASGTNIRPRLAEVVAQAAPQSQKSGEGLISLVRAVVDGAREGLDRSKASDRDSALRQVVDAMGDGLSQTALAGKLAIEEALTASRRYSREDLARIQADLTTVRDLFVETIDQGLKTCKTLTKRQLAAAKSHAQQAAQRMGRSFAQVHDSIQAHPTEVAQESLQTGAAMAQGATGALFQAVGRLLERAGEQLRREDGHQSN